MKTFRYQILFVFLMALFGFPFIVFAASEKDIRFPVAELGNCASKQERKAYRDVQEHFGVCIDFAKRYNPIPSDEASWSEIFAALKIKK